MNDSSARVLFVHHSVGRYILSKGHVRRKLAERIPTAELWDHDYNAIGLSDGRALKRRTAFPVPNDNTDPAGLLALLRGVADQQEFAQALRGFQVVVLKSCYPNNAISSDVSERELHTTYEQLLDVARTMPFSVVLATTPPLVPERTTRAQRERALRTAAWLASSWAAPNARVADLFTAMASTGGPLRGALSWSARRPWPLDSHPGPRGCERAADVLVEAIVGALEDGPAGGWL